MGKRERHMERIFLIQNFDLDEVNKFLQNKSGRVKFSHRVKEAVAGYGYAGGESVCSDSGFLRGDVFAYVVVEY